MSFQFPAIFYATLEISKNPRPYLNAFGNFLQRELYFTWVFWGLYESIRDLRHDKNEKDQI